MNCNLYKYSIFFIHTSLKNIECKEKSMILTTLNSFFHKFTRKNHRLRNVLFIFDQHMAFIVHDL